MCAPQAKKIFDERCAAERSELHFCNFCSPSRLADALNLQKHFCTSGGLLQFSGQTGSTFANFPPVVGVDALRLLERDATRRRTK